MAGKIKRYGIWGCTKILKKSNGQVISYRTPWLYDPYWGGCHGDFCGFKDACKDRLKSISKIRKERRGENGR